MRLRILFALLFAVLVTPFARPAAAQTGPRTKLFINTGPDPFLRYSHLRYGGRDWTTMTSLLQGSFDITTGSVLPDPVALLKYDALWVDQRYGTAPTARDLVKILGYAESGRRVVIVGENSSFYDFNFLMWSAPVIQALGGSQVPEGLSSGIGCLYGNVNTTLAHALTRGVSSVGVGCAGYATGGTSLFDYNVATLWGAPLNVLTLLDANIIDDDYPRMSPDGLLFQQNLVNWLDPSYVGTVSVVPEPATFAMLVPALLGLGAVAHSRRRSARTKQ